MLIEIDGDTTSVEVMRTKVTRIFGKGSTIRTLAQKGLLGRLDRQRRCSTSINVHF